MKASRVDRVEAGREHMKKMLAIPCKAKKQALIYLNERQLRAIVLPGNVALKES